MRMPHCGPKHQPAVWPYGTPVQTYLKAGAWRGVETWRDIRKHGVALEGKRDWRHAHRQRYSMLQGCTPYPFSPQATHSRAGTPYRAGKKQEDVKSCLCWSVILAWGKAIVVKWQRQGTDDHLVSAPFSFQSDIHFQPWEDTDPSSPSHQPQSPYLCFREASSIKLWPPPPNHQKGALCSLWWHACLLPVPEVSFLLLSPSNAILLQKSGYPISSNLLVGNI